MPKPGTFLLLGLMVLILLPTPISGAQRQTPTRDIRLTVHVRDEQGNPLAGLTKVTLQRDDGVVVEETNTDLEGRVQFENVPRANLVILARREGYLPASQKIMVRQLVFDMFLTFMLTRAPTVRKAAGPARVRADYYASPPKARKEYEKGIEEARRGNYSRATNHLEKAVALFAEFPTAWNDLGSEYLRLHKYKEAEVALRKAMELDGKFPAPLFNLGLLYNSQRRFGEAEPLLVRFLSLEESQWEGFFELGNSHYGLAQYAKAEADYKKAMKLNPHLPSEVHVKLGNTYASSRQFAKAFAEFKTYLQQSPQGPFAIQVRNVVEKMQADGVVEK